MFDKIGIAVVGAGYWGANYVRVFNELPDAEIVAVCDQRPERLAEINKRFPGTFVTHSLDTLLQLDDLDAVVVATGAATHFDLASRCIAGGKHVLVEKPLTTTPAQAERLIELADLHGVKLMVGHTFLHNPAIQTLRAYANGPEMGEVYYLYSRRTNLGPIRHDVNALWDLAPHDISIFNYLLGSTPQWVSAVAANVLKNQREDVGFISVGYAPNILGHIHVSWAEPNKVRELVVVGSNMRIVFDDLNTMERIRIFEKGISAIQPEVANFGEFQYQMRDGNILSPRVDSAEPLKNQCRHFINCIVHNQTPRTDGQSGLEVVRAMDAIDRSIQRRGAPVFLEEIIYDNATLALVAA
ncbi:MAG: Gfo/Idh/MocA family oxidoreductase [Caldilineaceae bacterium]|nr:Gfo/Idh/MocA family oxidoreductase [Caldilineaceae bacterium]